MDLNPGSVTNHVTLGKILIPFLSLSFLISKVGIIMIPNSYICDNEI